MLELVLIVASSGFRIGYLRAFSIGGLEALAGNLLFVVPFEIGAREGAFYALFNLFRARPAARSLQSIASRVRDFAWIGAGLMLIWMVGEKTPRAARAASAAPPA